jgi:tetratricopeptide (TPR) repeat protein
MKPLCLFIFIAMQFVAKDTLAQQNGAAKLLSAEKREAYIQKAIQLRREESYNGAAAQLDSVLIHNPADAPLLLFKGDLLLQAKQFADAVFAYKQLLPLNFEPTITQINLSYALFMNHRPALALRYAKKAWQQNNTSSHAVVNYFNAMLWNMQTKAAAVFLRQQDSLLTPAQQLVLQARLFTTSGNYHDGLTCYDSLLKLFPDKYYAQEYAEVLLGKKEVTKSIRVMRQAAHLFTQSEYSRYQQKIEATSVQHAGAEMVYFTDVAKNVRIEKNIWWQQSENRKYRLRFGAGSVFSTSAVKEKTNAQYAHVHINERWSRAWSGETGLRLQLIQPNNAGKFMVLTGQQTIKYQPNDRRMLGIQYSTDVLNFTAALLGKNIRSHNLGYVSHIMLSGKTGFYSEGSAGILSDKNQRYQFFGSLYRLFRTEPTVKTGINFSALRFSNTNVKNYFSPGRYLNTEVFADYGTVLPQLSTCYLQMQAAAGMQKIENNKWEAAIRMQAELGFRLKHLETAIKYQTSNVAAANGAGYSFNWFTARLVWKW